MDNVDPIRVDPISNDDAKWKREVDRVTRDLINALAALKSAQPGGN